MTKAGRAAENLGALIKLPAVADWLDDVGDPDVRDLWPPNFRGIADDARDEAGKS